VMLLLFLAPVLGDGLVWDIRVATNMLITLTLMDGAICQLPVPLMAQALTTSIWGCPPPPLPCDSSTVVLGLLDCHLESSADCTAARRASS
jgi:hypothetical protein